jgi:hypothetical protein
LIFERSTAKPTFGAPRHFYRIDMPSDPFPAGRYDKLLEAGMATRFIKGASGNPSGRPKRTQSRMNIKHLAERLQSVLVRPEITAEVDGKCSCCRSRLFSRIRRISSG